MSNSTYLHETHTIYVDSGELHLINDTQSIVININNFIHDLPSILYLCKKEYKKTNKELNIRLKQSLK